MPHTSVRPEPETPTGTAPETDDTAAPHRSIWSRTAKISVIGLAAFGVGRNVVDETRLAAALPHAARMGKVPLWLQQMATTAANNSIITPGLLDASLFQRNMYRVSTAIGATTGAMMLVSSIPALISGAHERGLHGMVQTQDGRSGIAQAAGGGLTVTLMAKAIHDSVGSGNFWDHMMTASRNPIFQKPVVVYFSLGMATLTGLNLAGYLDVFNEDNTRSFGRVMLDSTRKIPLLDTRAKRTTVFSGAAVGALGVGAGALAYQSRVLGDTRGWGKLIGNAGASLLREHHVIAAIGAAGVGLTVANQFGAFDWLADPKAGEQ
jgi:hypothetical protein